MVKRIKEDWFKVLRKQLQLKSFIANMLECTARLKTKINYVCITMCSIVTSSMSRDLIKTEIKVSTVL